MISRTGGALSSGKNSVTSWDYGSYELHLLLGTALALGARSSSMNELKTGFLMLLVCAAFYVLTDPRVWGGLCQFVGRLVGGVN